MRLLSAAFILALVATGARPAAAQVVVAEHGDQKLTIGGYLQAQYARADPAASEAADRVLFRRMVMTLQGSTTRHWLATFQLDFAPAASHGGRVVVKDANLQYVGFRDRGLTITAGNQKPPFSRSILTSSARRHLVERPFTGDRVLGSLGRALGVKVDGTHRSRRLFWSGEIGSSLHAPEANQVRTDGLAEAGSDWNEGVLLVGRLEMHPRGETPRDQGEFRSEAWKYSVALAGYAWTNDGDRNLYTLDGRSTSAGHADTSDVKGLEMSAGVRGHRLSMDAELERIESHSIDTRFTGGLYKRGEAVLLKGSVEAGYMVIARRLEVVAAYDAVNAGTYDRPWQRVATGLNWYSAEHAVKFQIMHRVSRDDRGVPGASIAATFVQAQAGF